MITVQTEWNEAAPPNYGRVDVKVAYLLSGKDEEIVSVKAEFDHCRAISMVTNIPIQTVANQAVRLAQEQLKNPSSQLPL
jgi:uncharacterized protein (DUF111 family)